MSRLAYILCLLLFCHENSMAEPLYEQELLHHAGFLRLWEHPMWHRILFYRETKSIVDSPGFFITGEQGATNPELEMREMIQGIFAPLANYSDANLHPQCAFPRRFKWLAKQLEIKAASLPQVVCTNRTKFLEALKPQRLSLLFSSYFVNNPASLFGHTLLRVHRDAANTGGDDGLLDHAINFAAQLDGIPSPLAYVYKGVFGGYPGRFGITPLYLKIQEYNNHESRDLWEYQLAFSADQIDDLMRSLWEWGTYSSDYYYFSENCSFVLLMLIEAAREDLQLTDHLHPWVMPLDTLQALTRAPGLIVETRYRPSSFSRLETRMAYLTGEDAALVPTLAYDPMPVAEQLKERPTPAKARIIDATIELVDFQEKLAANLEPKDLGPRRRELLSMRASLGIPADELRKIPLEREPGRAHRTNKIGLGLGVDRLGGGHTLMRWRPALHDLADSSLGFAPDLEIHVLDTELDHRWIKGDLVLRNLDVFAVRSFAPLTPINHAVAWQISSGFRSGFRALAPEGRELYGRVGAGVAFELTSWRLHAYVLPTVDLSWGLASSRGLLAPGLDCGLFAAFGQRLHLTLDHRHQFILGQTPQHWSTQLMLSFAAFDHNELRLGLTHTVATDEVAAAWSWYL
jgi:hypothetical protein